MVVRWTLPRFRFDQIMKLAWEGMIPTAMMVLLVTSVFVFLGWQDQMWIGGFGGLLLVWLLAPMFPKQQNPNRRVPLIGSRFSPLSEQDAAPASAD